MTLTKWGYAATSTAVGAVFFGLVGDVNRFPYGLLGFAGFLVGVFGVALLAHGRVD
jgi:hypothetical protein